MPWRHRIECRHAVVMHVALAWEGGRWPLFHAIFGSMGTVEAKLVDRSKRYCSLIDPS